MRITIFQDAGGVRGAAHDVTWPQVVAQCVAPPTYPSKQDCPLIKLATFGEQRTERGSLRHSANILTVSGVELDYDAGTVTPSDAAGLLALMGIEALVYTSPSHTSTAPRWRVLAPLSREYAPENRREFVGRINAALGGICAAESYVMVQSFYIGRVDGVEYECIPVEGQCVDLLVNLPAVYPEHGASRVEPTDVPARPYTPNPEAEKIARQRIEDTMRDAPDGERHYARLRAAKLAGGFISGGVLDYEPTLAWLRCVSDDISDGGDTTRTELDTLMDGIRAGYAAPCESPRPPLDLSSIGFGAGVTASHYAPVAKPITGATYVHAHQISQIFKGVVWVQSINKMFFNGDEIDRPRFDANFSRFTFMLDAANTVKAKSPWDAFHSCQVEVLPKAHDTCFRPELPPGCCINENGRVLLNTWWPLQTPCAEGDVTPFLRHMGLLFPIESDQLQIISYMAGMVQYPGVKFQWSPVIQGCEGSGKSFIGDCMEAAIGETYCHKPNASDIANKFTGWLRRKLCIVVEEIMIEHKRELLDALKPLITNRRIEIQNKGSDQVTGDNRANFIMFTNFKNAIPMDVDKRRYGVYFTPQQSFADMVAMGMSGEYFPNLYAWARSGGFAAINWYLRSFKIPDSMNPAGAMHRAPTTSSTAEAIAESLGTLEQDILECVESGEMGFKGGWISTIMLARRFERRGVTLRRLGSALHHLGYVKHPGLRDGRCDDPVVIPDGGKPRLYIKPDHSSATLTAHTAIVGAYVAAQMAHT